MSLYEKWLEYSKRGGLDTAGCQILADWKREVDQLRVQLFEAQAQVSRLREALESVNWEAKQDDHYAILSITGKTLSYPSPAADKWKAMVDAIDAAHDVVADFGEILASHPQIMALAKALAALEAPDAK